MIVRQSDVIAYLGRDIEDAVLAGIVSKNNIPKKVKKYGDTNGKLIESFVKDVIENSIVSISFSDNLYNVINELKEFNVKNIYESDRIREYRNKGINIIKDVYSYYIDIYSEHGYKINKYKGYYEDKFSKYLDKMHKYYKSQQTSGKDIVCDYVSGMTDKYILEVYKYIKIPEPIKFDGLIT